MRIQRLASHTVSIGGHTVVIQGGRQVEMLTHMLYDSIKAKWLTYLRQPRYAQFLDGH